MATVSDHSCSILPLLNNKQQEQQQYLKIGNKDVDDKRQNTGIKEEGEK